MNKKSLKSSNNSSLAKPAICLTYSQINDSCFASGLNVLNNSRKLDAKTAYRVGRIYRAARKAMETASKFEDQLKAEFLKDKKLVRDETLHKEKFANDEAQKEWDERLQGYLKEQVMEAAVHKLDFAALGEAGLAPKELAALEPILNGLPE